MEVIIIPYKWKLLQFHKWKYSGWSVFLVLYSAPNNAKPTDCHKDFHSQHCWSYILSLGLSVGSVSSVFSVLYSTLKNAFIIPYQVKGEACTWWFSVFYPGRRYNSQQRGWPTSCGQFSRWCSTRRRTLIRYNDVSGMDFLSFLLLSFCLCLTSLWTAL